MAKRQKNRQHNGQKTEEQTTQWPKDRRTDNTMATRQKDRQQNGQKKKYKRTNNDLKHTYKTKDRVTRTPLKTGRVHSSCSISGTRGIDFVSFSDYSIGF
jgi:hypothetical protein